MSRSRLRDITDIYSGEFYIEAKGLSSLAGKVYDTREILSGEDSLPEAYLDDEITIFPWDGGSVVVLIRDHTEFAA